MAEGPSKSDIEAVFKRLRAIPTNKTCFDCGAKNPTWSSVTFGVFICIDCSSVHRNLGVHLTFVRSTQLDTQWTWLQIRNMQLGGNANAHAFFRQHNCSTADAQQKYTSRAAVLYKEKLANMSQQYMRIHGTQLHVDGHGLVHDNQSEKKEEDFFSQHDAFLDSNTNSNGSLSFKAPVPEPVKVAPATQATGSSSGPNVNVINAAPVETAEPKVAKSLIGQRKPAAKKPGLGAKKGLGATKVQANFDEIEREAHMADAMRAQKPAEVKPEEAEQKAASLSLAFQELAMQTKKQSEIMQKVDPKNAEQVERIGMGILANKAGHRPVISHSIGSDMTMISQDSSTVTKTNASVLASLERNQYSSDDTPSSFYSKNSGLDDLLSRDSSSKSSRDSEWDMLSDFTPAPKSSSSTSFGAPLSAPTNSGYGSSISSSSKSSNLKYGSSSKSSDASVNSGEAVKKFANAKAISSDQFFQDSGNADYERRANLSRFEGSSGISSSDYFGTGSTSGRSRNTGSSLNIQAPDLDDVKESVRQGVTKVASKLSNLANDFASSIQDRYGY